MSLKIVHFQNGSPKGFDLSQLIYNKFNQNPDICLDSCVRIVENGDQFDFLQACLGEDVVIFDGSVEDEKGSNYKAATAQATCMDHVLVVGRTKLPLNFFGLRKGGYPELIRRSSRQTEKYYQNESIINWLEEQIFDIAKNPRPEDERVRIPSLKEISAHTDELSRINQKIMERSLVKYDLRNYIFVSYLSSIPVMNINRS